MTSYLIGSYGYGFRGCIVVELFLFFSYLDFVHEIIKREMGDVVFLIAFSVGKIINL